MEIKKFGFYFLLGIILVLTFKFYFIIENLIPSIAAGFVLAYLTNPIYLYLLRVTKRATLSALIVIFIIIVVILIPIIIITFAVQEQVKFISQEYSISTVLDALRNINHFLLEKLDFYISDAYLTNIYLNFVSTAQRAVTVIGPKLILSITRLVLYTFVSIFLVYYFLKHSTTIITTFRRYFPLTNERVDTFLNQIGKETKVLILGQLLIAVIQGILAGIGFLIFGVPNVIIWGLVTVILSFVPVLGAGLVWFPIGLVLLGRGQFFNGMGVLVWGALIVSASDNLIRPKLISTLGKIHPVTVLLGVFIGIKEWGIIGIVIGPLLISVLLILIRMFREEYLIESTTNTRSNSSTEP